MVQDDELSVRDDRLKEKNEGEFPETKKAQFLAPFEFDLKIDVFVLFAIS